MEEAEEQAEEFSNVSLEETEQEEDLELEPMYRSEQEEDREESHTYSPNFILSYPTESIVDELEDESAPFDYSQPFSAEAKKQGDPVQTPEYKWGNPTAIPAPSIPKLPDFSFAGKRAEGQSIQEEEVPPSPSFEVDVQEVAGQVAEVESVQQESSSSSSSSDEKPGLLKKFTKKKSMSIAEFLGRKSENELQAKLKVCIVQQGDTLDSISERYALPIQQILRVNHLEANQDVYEGQVLYIPETAGSR
ncbi:LysM peptidoglycan-binding domain-containing protein [Bacillus sp. T3]|uniref:LysM peptidoglycan-binding domain-containing protein n=1 Tax=Bacillus sp. T3 TaxID=467262 RepID=UPI002980F1A5|nr:LysM peptidoglycan-binding domain-containing protein [Bacillus sp. T3]